MDNTGGPTLFPLHRCKTIHLVGSNFPELFCCTSYWRFQAVMTLFWRTVEVDFPIGFCSQFWRLCGLIKTIYLGEAWSGHSQCWRRQELQSIPVSWIFWCIPYYTWLATGGRASPIFSLNLNTPHPYSWCTSILISYISLALVSGW